MKFASLGSGSRGNATLVAFEDQLLLIDCGFTIKETEARLERLGYRAEDVSAVLVTHEHSDHLKGVPPLSRKYGMPVYMTAGTFRSRDLGKLPELNLIEGYRPFELGNILIQPVAVPHDANEPTQFVFEAGDKRLGVLTDLGTISAHVEDCFSDCDGLLLEANHDPQMLAYGPYPPSLKRRVGGPWGHLSNQQAAGFLHRSNRERLQTLVVGHISQKNNCVERARETLADATDGIERVVYACQEQGFGWLHL
ncbi:MBL fold metallo-hydrolase [Pseudomaricurvus alkylphenolicus]|jgi:phosphoribosyl 1,2-cyclic phosphodiesterase|uniref:MBL fold metallo-hydrolase n=1 Tax=Pseudomaricurvus alkylphenolicus TaxID=1306991 RepID=UPI00141F5669|nr:MBL fold metallo-hydrolase [Pseudomaricurvus alkylphenolicus]NIB42037.1 MBL fold metallo-hydrolase [Pseudomaricurvus alkylphenolicus]